MCRSIQTLRPPFVEQVGDAEVHAAALQYVRKISGFRKPAGHNQAAFDDAVAAVAAATADLLARLEVRPSPTPALDPAARRERAARRRAASPRPAS